MMGHLIKRSSLSFGFDCVELHVKRLGLLIFIRLMVELLVRFVATVFCERMLFNSFYEGIQIEFTWRMNRDSSKRMKVFCMNMNWAAYLSKGLPFLYTKQNILLFMRTTRFYYANNIFILTKFRHSEIRPTKQFDQFRCTPHRTNECLTHFWVIKSARLIFTQRACLTSIHLFRCSCISCNAHSRYPHTWHTNPTTTVPRAHAKIHTITRFSATKSVCSSCFWISPSNPTTEFVCHAHNNTHTHE